MELGAGATAEVVARLRAAGCVFAEEEAELLAEAAGGRAELAAMVDRRVAGIPIEHLLGWAAFAGLRVAVAPGVFVPRRRSELLVRLATELLRRAGGNPSVAVDLCCGSGALGAALVAAVPTVVVHAADLDPAAVACARANLRPPRGHVHEGDLDAALPAALAQRVDVLVANAPYVPTAEIAFMPVEARQHEPALALDGGPDGLDVGRAVVACAHRWLAPGGHLVVETSSRQASALAAAFARHGLTPEVVHDDDADATAVVGVAAARVRDVRERRPPDR